MARIPCSATCAICACSARSCSRCAASARAIASCAASCELSLRCSRRKAEVHILIVVIIGEIYRTYAGGCGRAGLGTSSARCACCVVHPTPAAGSSGPCLLRGAGSQADDVEGGRDSRHLQPHMRMSALHLGPSPPLLTVLLV
jgi:hypothetical protein